MTRKEAALKYLAENEGGFANESGDKGGPTMWGITERLARKHGVDDVKKLTRNKADEILLAEFWLFDEVRNGRIAVKLFDHSVNMGSRAALKQAQLAIKDLGYLIDIDGLIGTYTIRKLNEVMIDNFLDAYCKRLENFYKAIAFRDPSQGKFLSGWKKRAWRVPVSVPNE